MSEAKGRAKRMARDFFLTPRRRYKIYRFSIDMNPYQPKTKQHIEWHNAFYDERKLMKQERENER